MSKGAKSQEEKTPKKDESKWIKESKKKGPIRYTREMWGQMKAEYVAGATMTQLAKKYPPTLPTISRYAKRHGWGECGSLMESKAFVKSRDKVVKEHEQFLREALEDAAFHHVTQARNGQAMCHKQMAILQKQLKNVKKLTKEPYLMQALANATKVYIDMERQALGITDGVNIIKEETPLDKFAKTIALERDEAGVFGDEVGVGGEGRGLEFVDEDIPGVSKDFEPEPKNTPKKLK